MMNNTDKIKIFLVYFILMAGGLWHILGYFKYIMQIAAGPLLMFFALWMVYEHLAGTSSPRWRWSVLIWSIVVILSSFVIEVIGVKTGSIFGHYAYGNTLIPTISGVPLAIGFAWLLVAYASTAIVQRLQSIRPLKAAGMVLLIALLMTLFDFFMEPAAIRLGYWTWEKGHVPVQNYLAWFILGFVLSLLGYIMNIFRKQIPIIAVHIYFAQIIYFVMVYFKTD
ncbi:MAG: carotenoid biosynthesis protein [Caldithrix sp.]|nr:carotenoid biosynthesis protein [Caldithrix sp.]